MANFLPRGMSIVNPGADGRVKGIIASCMGKPVLFQIVNNKPRRRATKDIPFFSIPPVIYGQLTSQLTRVIADRQAEAEKFASIKKPDWAKDLEKFGMQILPNGRLKISKWIKNKFGTKRRIWLQVGDIDSAIRMQKHVLKSYSDKIKIYGFEDMPEELWEILERLSIIQPVIEMRQELLIWAKKEMQSAFNQAEQMINDLMAKAKQDGMEPIVLANQIHQLAFFLKNQWICPYRLFVDQALANLRLAYSQAKKAWLNTARYYLVQAKNNLALTKPDEKTNGFTRLDQISPIKVLVQIHKANLTQAVWQKAKERFPGQEKFRLAEMLIIGQIVLGQSTQLPLF